MKLRFILVALLFCLCTTTPLHAGSVTKEFSALWDARDKDYREQRPKLDKTASETAASAVSAILANQENGPILLDAALRAAQNLSELVGRGQTLWALRQHMDSKPSSSKSEAWMQGKMDELSSAIKNADANEGKIRSTRIGRDIGVEAWVGAVEQLAMARGTIEGSVAELALIDRNLESFYVALGQEKERRRAARAAILGAIGAALVQQQQTHRTWSVSCTRFGNLTNCNGN